MTSEPRSSNASSASSARSQATVRGVGHAGGGEQRRGEELVDRVLDRERAVDGAHADGGQRVQRVDAEDDLLERAARDRAHDHDVARVERDLARAHREAAVDPAHHPRHGGEGAFVPAGGQRALQPLGVPASGRADDCDAHAYAILYPAGGPADAPARGGSPGHRRRRQRRLIANERCPSSSERHLSSDSLRARRHRNTIVGRGRSGCGEGRCRCRVSNRHERSFRGRD